MTTVINPTEPIVFDGTESSVCLIAELMENIYPGLFSTFMVHGTLHTGGHSFKIGTSFNVILPDEIQITLPSAVKMIDIEFKFEDWSCERYRK